MIGDKYVIKEQHRRAAQELLRLLEPRIVASAGVYTITVAGESGCGKTVTARALADALNEGGMRTVVLQQDDYFLYPPRTNDRARRKDIRWVGLREVRLDLLDEHLGKAREGEKTIAKPLVVYEEDRILEETVSLQDVKVLIAEGTYVMSLSNCDVRIFIGATYLDTLPSRRERAREAQDDFLEKVLEIEHLIIRSHKAKADIVIDRDSQIVLAR